VIASVGVEVLMEAMRAFLFSWSELLALLVTVTGFTLIPRQLRFQSMGLRGEAFTVLTGLSLDIMKYIADNPELYKYFYESQELRDDDVNRVKVLCCAEMIANYLDAVVMHKSHMPKSVWGRWKVFITEQVRSSPALRDFVNEYRQWYSNELVRELEIAGLVK
jgi:hypothetical protein